MSTTVTATTDQIRLVGLSARGHHGVLPFEREEGQLFTVDVTLDLGQRGTAVVAVTDSLDDTVDYAAVATAVVTIIEGEPVNLLETLAGRIADKVLGFPRVAAAEVTVHKPQAPLDVAFEDVSVSIYRVADDAAGQGGIQPVTQAAWAASGASAAPAGQGSSAAPAGQGYSDQPVQAVPVPGAFSAPAAGTPGPVDSAGSAASPGSATLAGDVGPGEPGGPVGPGEPPGLPGSSGAMETAGPAEPLTSWSGASAPDTSSDLVGSDHAASDRAASAFAASPGSAGPGGTLEDSPAPGVPGIGAPRGAHTAEGADPWAPDPWIRDTADDASPGPVGSAEPVSPAGSAGSAGTAGSAEDLLGSPLGGLGGGRSFPGESLEASAASALMGDPVGQSPSGEGRHAALSPEPTLDYQGGPLDGGRGGSEEPPAESASPSAPSAGLLSVPSSVPSSASPSAPSSTSSSASPALPSSSALSPEGGQAGPLFGPGLQYAGGVPGASPDAGSLGGDGLPGGRDYGGPAAGVPDQTQAWPAGQPYASSEPSVSSVASSQVAGVSDPLEERPGRPVGAVFALGANVGHLLTTLRQAVHALKSTEGIEVVQVAPLARSVAMVPEGSEPQPDFLNTVVTALTTLSARELLAVCQRLERDAGRVRTGHWGPRSLDVDLVMLEGVTSDDPELALPHPRARERAFVLVPWSQADPFAELGGQTVAELAEQAPDRGGLRWLAFDWLDTDNIPDKPTGPYVAPPVAENVPDPTGVVYDATRDEGTMVAPGVAAEYLDSVGGVPGSGGSTGTGPGVQEASWTAEPEPRDSGVFGAQAPLAGGPAGAPVEPAVPEEYVVLGDQEPPEGPAGGAPGQVAQGGVAEGDSWESPLQWNDVIGGAGGGPGTGPRQGA